MLEISTLVEKLKNIGYDLFLEGEKLRYKSLSLIEPPKEEVLPLLTIIKANRGAVIEYLRQKEKPELAYKIYSEILDDFIWVCKTEADRRRLQRRLQESGTLAEAIYTEAEIVELKKLPKDSEMLKELHKIKSIFDGSTRIDSI